MKKILLEIIGTQRIDNQKDKIEFTTVGTFEEEEDSYIVKYVEEQEPPLKSVDVSVKIYKNEKSVEIIRSGAHDSCLIVERSKRNLCSYGTEYGDVLMGISGHSVRYDKENSEFYFNYDIDINGALASKNEVSMKFRVNQE